MCAWNGIPGSQDLLRSLSRMTAWLTLCSLQPSGRIHTPTALPTSVISQCSYFANQLNKPYLLVLTGTSPMIMTEFHHRSSCRVTLLGCKMPLQIRCWLFYWNCYLFLVDMKMSLAFSDINPSSILDITDNVSILSIYHFCPWRSLLNRRP